MKEDTKSENPFQAVVFKAMLHDIAVPYIWSNVISSTEHMQYYELSHEVGGKRHSIVCQIGCASDNFMEAYSRPGSLRLKLPDEGNFLVMSEHFRNHLAIPEFHGSWTGTFTKTVLPDTWKTACKASKYVPDAYLRHSMKLAKKSLWLGRVGLALGMLGVVIGVAGLYASCFR